MVDLASMSRGPGFAVVIVGALLIAAACATSSPQIHAPTSSPPPTTTNIAEPQPSPAASGTTAEAPTPSAEPAPEPPPTAAEIAANEIADEVWAFYRDKQTFKAKFRQRGRCWTGDRYCCRSSSGHSGAYICPIDIFCNFT